MRPEVKELLAMRWGVHGGTLVCTGENGEGLVMCDTEAGFMLTEEQSMEVARHIVALHNESLARKGTERR